MSTIVDAARTGLPRPLQLAGWCLAVVTAFYPVDAVLTWLDVRDLLTAEQRPPIPVEGGMVFDLRTMDIHCGMLGWLGGVGAALSMLWLVFVLANWVARRNRRQGPLVPRSRWVIAAVMASLLTAFATQLFFEHVFGITLVDGLLAPSLAAQRVLMSASGRDGLT